MVENKPLSCTPIGVQPLQGSRIRLVRAAPEYIDFIYACYHNDRFMDLYRLAQSRAISKKELLQRLSTEHNQSPQALKRIEWVILKQEQEALTPIGLAALADHQVSHRRAEFLLGIPEAQNRTGNLGLEASLLVLEFAFNLAGLNKVTSFVYGYNSRAQNNTLHLGFKQEGFFAEHIQTPSGFIDLYQNGLLRRDFQANKSISRFSRRLLKRDITETQTAHIEKLPTELLKKLQLKLKS
ncbi:MAG: GNAT family N-acetyltransferase [Methyloprofundus sp.]|nr:GNAT family N-acetyltransferase [Methyloprofundus sp.]